MKTKHFLLASLTAILLFGCSRFSEDHFYTESFGIDLRSHTLMHESSYTDGILEVYDVSPADDLYQAAFKKNDIQRTTEWLFGYRGKRYYASENSPIDYVHIGDDRDGLMKYVLYLPQKMMVFIYADAVGG